jgi:hypothetical protein
MIDYQMSSEGNPVCDILNVIFNCTNREGKEKYFNEWIDCYHDQLSRSLAYFGLKSAEIYPKEQLFADIKTFARLQCGQSLFALSIFYRDSNDSVDLQDKLNKSKHADDIQNSLGVSNMSVETKILFKKRIEDLVSSFIHLGFY